MPPRSIPVLPFIGFLRAILHALVPMAYQRAHAWPRSGAYKGRGMEYILYFSNAPAPKEVSSEQLERLIPVHFSSVDDALHGAALVIRGGQYPWLIEGPDVRLEAPEIGERCEPILKLIKRSPGEKK